MIEQGEFYEDYITSGMSMQETNPHLALWASENYVSQGERDWLRWVAKVERLVGHDIDGNQDCDGYSLDFACACWESGDTAELYAADVIINKAAQDAAFGSRIEVAA